MSKRESRFSHQRENKDDGQIESCKHEQKEKEERSQSNNKGKDMGAAFNEILLNIIIDIMTLDGEASKIEIAELKKQLLTIDYFDLRSVKLNDCLGHFYLSKLALIEERLSLLNLKQLIDLSKVKGRIMQKIREGIRDYSAIEIAYGQIKSIRQRFEKDQQSQETASSQSSEHKRDEGSY